MTQLVDLVVSDPGPVSAPDRGRAAPLARRLVGIAGGVVLAAAVVMLALVGIGPRFGHYRVLTVLTASMRPTASRGSLIVVLPIPLSQVRKGMVLTYQTPLDDHRVLSHRVVEVTDQGTDHPTIRTKGDANAAVDPWMATLHGSTAWQMRAAIPRLGTVVRWLRSPALHRLSTLVVPFALAAIWLSAIWRPRRHGDAGFGSGAPLCHPSPIA